MKDNRLDFDDAHIHIEIRGQHINTRDIALGVSTYLVDRVSGDDLMLEQTFPEPFEPQFQLDVGGLTCSYLTKSHQLAVLASALASYGNYRYQHCWIGLNDYLCLKELREDIDFDVYQYNANNGYGRGISDYMQDTQTFLLTLLHWFEEEYGRRNPEFAKNLTFEKLKQ